VARHESGFDKRLPLLVKFIFPTDKLSIQVHPDDSYASVHEKKAGGCGKTEMWHAVSAEAGAHVLIGLVPKADEIKFLEALDSNTIENLFVHWRVHREILSSCLRAHRTPLTRTWCFARCSSILT